MAGEAPPIPVWFRQQMARLMALKFAPSDLVTHWEALCDHQEAVIRVAVDHAQRACDAFPSPKELREFAIWERSKAIPIESNDDRSEPLDEPVTLGTLPTGKPIIATRTWRFYCDQCEDLGMRELWCGYRHVSPLSKLAQLPVRWCGRNACKYKNLGEGYGHSWVEPCPCAETNPDVIKRRERALQGPRRGASE